MSISHQYASRYTSDKLNAVYPVEFVVRAFLGTYPNLHMPRDRYEGQRILDLGYGDGRNMPLLNNLGMKIHGVEIAEEINRHVMERLSNLGIRADLKAGSNAHIPYKDNHFQFALACHSCYYVEAGDTFSTNLTEITRVLEPGGYFIASLPMTGSYILKDAKFLTDGHYEITSDPYGLRNGTVFRAFDSEEEIRETFAPFYHDISIGFCDDMFWGIHQKVWTIVCCKK
jgi:ubiquinone/menaquinone biosynthesis C-methylase UbiE